MSVTAAIFRKDLRQLRILTGLLGVLLAVLVVVRLEWAGGVAPGLANPIRFSPGLEGMLFIVVFVLAGKMAGNAIFADSPGRRERFLATRPVPTRSLILAKLAYLAAFVIAPFALATLVYLVLSGMPARVVFLGMVQTLVWGAVLLGLAAPLVLLGENRRRFIAGLAAVGLGIAVPFVVLDWLRARGSDLVLFRADHAILDPRSQIAIVAIAALILAGIAVLHLRRPLVLKLRLPAMLLAGIAAVLLGGRIVGWSPAGPGGDVPECRMVSSSFGRHVNTTPPRLSISLAPGVEVPRDRDVRWSFAHASLGRDALPLPLLRSPELAPSSYLHSGGLTRGIEAALFSHLGPDWAVGVMRWGQFGRETDPRGAGAHFAEGELSAEPGKLSAGFRGETFSWRVAVELPLEPGRTVHDGADRWTFHACGRTPGGGERSLTLALSQRGPSLWIAPGSAPPKLEWAACSFFLLDHERQLLIPFDSHHPVRGQLAGGTACPRHGLSLRIQDSVSPATNEHELTGELLATPGRFRLLILRPRYEGARFCRWTSPAPVDLRALSPADGGGLADTPRDLKPDDIARWLEEHPGPDPAAPTAEVASYFAAALAQTNRCSGLRDTHPLVAALAAYVPGHFDLFLRALSALEMDHHTSQQVLEDALGAGLRRRQLPALAACLAARPWLVRVVERRGWSADIAPDLALLIRTGIHDRAIIEVAAALPDTAGITREEWLAIFRMRPGVGTYRLLRKIPALESELDAAVDAWLSGRLPLFDEDHLDPVINLALERGKPGAPAQLHRAASYALQLDRHGSHSFHHAITRNFDLSSFPDHHGDPDRIVPWFLKQDPASFTWDPATRRYTPEPNQNSEINNQ